MRWPLVGREDVLAAIGERLRDPACRGVVVAGDAGVGKTRLLVEASQASDLAVEWVRATRSAASMPLGAFAALLPPEPAGGSELLARLRWAIAERAGHRRLLLCVDDGHLLDDASAALVHQLGAAGEAFVLVAVRLGEPVPDALRALWKDELCDLVELGALDRDAVTALLRDVLGGPLDGRTLDAAWRLTRGHPMYLRELVRYGTERGMLADEGGIWRWRGPMGVGTRLAELVGSRLADLEPEALAALETIAVGAPLELDLLDASQLEALAKLDGVAEVRADRRRRYADLVHPMYGDAVRARIPRVRVEALQRRLADAVEARGARRRGDVLRVAAWRLDSGGAGDPALFERAAAHALAAFDIGLAERLARAAGDRFEARLLLGRALAADGRGEQAEAVLRSLAPREDAGRAAVAIVRARNLLWALDRSADADALLRAAERSVGTEVRGELTAQRVRLLAAAGRAGEALDAAGPLLADDGIAEVARVHAVVGSVEALFCVGRLVEANALAEAWLPAARRQRDQAPQLAVVLESEIGVALRYAGRLEEATRVSERVYAAALGSRSGHTTAVEATMLGFAWLARGRVATAQRMFRESAALMRDADASGMLALALAGLAQAAGQAGDAASAGAAVAELDRVPIGYGSFAFELDLGRAWAAAAAGELTRARDHARAGALLAERRGQLAFELRALHELLRLGATDVGERLAALAAEVDGPFAQLAALHAAAIAPGRSGPTGSRAARAGASGGSPGCAPPAAGSRSPLLDVAEAFADQDALLVASEIARAAAGALRAEGRTASARTADARAAVWLDRCEGARPPTLLEAPAADELTPREREVALLAAGGASSRQIAQSLVVSVRTVDNHLQRVYRKLGVTRRDELAGVLGTRVE